MYKIKIREIATGKEWWEYRFTSDMMFLINQIYDYNCDEALYEILWIFKLNFTFDIFKKCFKKYNTL